MNNVKILRVLNVLMLANQFYSFDDDDALHCSAAALITFFRLLAQMLWICANSIFSSTGPIMLADV